MTWLARLFRRAPRATDQRVAALEHEIAAQRRLLSAVLYALGAQPGLHHERLRRDLLAHLSRGRDDVPASILDDLEDGITWWRDEGLPRRVVEAARRLRPAPEGRR